MLPGFYAGFTAVARDESRHVNYGVRAIMEAGIKDPAYLDRVEATIRRLLPQACRIVAAPDRKFAISPADTPENLRISPYEVRAFSLTSLTKRLRVAGLSQEVCEDITRTGLEYYDAAWAEYEDLHGIEHPRRYYDQLATA
jgi:ribonucleoside-diphosphate reductase beta chain